MKVFERVIKKKIMNHLIANQQLNDGQHGFVPSRSTKRKRLDTKFLDFAKAFDKIGHSILLEKVKKK